MGITVLDETAFTTSVWSGGKTTEMYLYPQTASYRNRNFLFRISSATVEEEASTFTRLPGIHREILLLNGQPGVVKLISDEENPGIIHVAITNLPDPA